MQWSSSWGIKANISKLTKRTESEECDFYTSSNTVQSLQEQSGVSMYSDVQSRKSLHLHPWAVPVCRAGAQTWDISGRGTRDHLHCHFQKLSLSPIVLNTLASVQTKKAISSPERSNVSQLKRALLLENGGGTYYTWPSRWGRKVSWIKRWFCKIFQVNILFMLLQKVTTII